MICWRGQNYHNSPSCIFSAESDYIQLWLEQQMLLVGWVSEWDNCCPASQGRRHEGSLKKNDTNIRYDTREEWNVMHYIPHQIAPLQRKLHLTTIFQISPQNQHRCDHHYFSVKWTTIHLSSTMIWSVSVLPHIIHPSADTYCQQCVLVWVSQRIINIFKWSNNGRDNGECCGNGLVEMSKRFAMQV